MIKQNMRETARGREAEWEDGGRERVFFEINAMINLWVVYLIFLKRPIH